MEVLLWADMNAATSSRRGRGAALPFTQVRVADALAFRNAALAYALFTFPPLFCAMGEN